MCSIVQEIKVFFFVHGCFYTQTAKREIIEIMQIYTFGQTRSNHQSSASGRSLILIPWLQKGSNMTIYLKDHERKSGHEV